MVTIYYFGMYYQQGSGLFLLCGCTSLIEIFWKQFSLVKDLTLYTYSFLFTRS